MFDSKEMFNLGYAFLNAGEVNFIEGRIKNRSEYQNLAGIVNVAFACELFIKCLHNTEEVQSKGHDIAELWKKYKDINGNIATEIESAVMSRLVTDMSFDDMLHNDSNVFCNFRYIYETQKLEAVRKSPLRPQFLKTFAYELAGHLQNHQLLQDREHLQCSQE